MQSMQPMTQESWTVVPSKRRSETQHGTSHVNGAVFRAVRHDWLAHLNDELWNVFHDGCDDLSRHVCPVSL